MTTSMVRAGLRPRMRHACARIRLLAGVLLAMHAGAASLRADALDEIRARGALIWGGDQEGGGPYVYPDPRQDGRVIGYEVDLAELIAKHLGVRAQFFQGDWDTLPQFLNAGKIDIVLCGYEWTRERATQMLASRPYYIYELQLLAREGDPRISSWADLKAAAAHGWMVGVLEGSSAAAYMREHYPDVTLRPYDGNTNAMAQVRAGVDVATLQDGPIAIFYKDLPQEQGLRFVGSPVGTGHYVMYARRGQERLVEAVNKALDQALLRGDLRRVYEKWGLWNPTQEQLAFAAPRLAEGKAVSGWSVVRRYAPTLLRAAGMTVFLSVTAMPLAIVLGLLIALGRLYGPGLLRIPLTVYVEVIRGTPVMLQLFVLFFVIPALLPDAVRTWGPAAFALAHWSIMAAILGLAINYSAYEAENYRAGLQSIPPGQMDAALALGMPRRVALRRVIVPQAVRIVIPPVTNDFISLFKDTSICSVIAVTELTKQYNVLANSTGAVIELAAMTAILYLAMSYPLSLLARRAERLLEGPRSHG